MLGGALIIGCESAHLWFCCTVSITDETPLVAEHAAAQAVYGTILASALVSALDTTPGPPHLAHDIAWLAITMVASALAHGYSTLLTLHPRRGQRLRAAWSAISGEWPLVAAGAPTVIVLLFARFAGRWPADNPIHAALGINVLALFAWGLASARRAGYERAAAFGIAVFDAAIGALIIALNILVK